MIGRPKTGIKTQAKCEYCGNPFTYLAYPLRPADAGRGRPEAESDHKDEDLRFRNPRHFCGRACHLADQRDRRRKLPFNVMIVVDLYLNKNRSTAQIAEIYGCNHKQVRALLLRQGVKLRRKTSTKTCIVSGCNRPAAKILHRGNNSLYGTRCWWHRKLHRAKVHRDYQRRRRGTPPEKWRVQQ